MAACGSAEFASPGARGPGGLDPPEDARDPGRLDPSEGASDWTRFRGPNGSGHAPRQEELDTRNHPASASPAVDDTGHVYVFFGDFGLVSYDAAGVERWRVPLGPFTNV